MARVLVSAGHTNADPGTVVNGIREADLNRRIADEVIRLLRDNGVITLAVPPNLDLPTRIEWINQTGYHEAKNDVLVEIHVNDGGKTGVEGWYKADSEKSRTLTQYIVNSVAQNVNWVSQGVKSEYEHPFGSLAFLHNTLPISSLVECGYMDNPSDLKILQSQDGVTKIAQGVVNGILSFFNLKPIEQKKTASTANVPASNRDNGQTIQKTTSQAQNVNAPSTNNTQSSPQPKQPVSATTVKQQTSISAQNQVNTNFNNAPSTQPVNNSITNATNQLAGGAVPSKSPTQNFAPPKTSFQQNSFTNNNFSSSGFNTNSWGTSGTQTKKFMTREERKEMIKKNYVKILGREPNQSDLNYFLNISISEQDLIKRMVDSQEHADLVKARQEVIKIKEKFVKQKDELLRLRVKTKDQQSIIKNLNALLMQKNRIIFELQQRLQQLKTLVPHKGKNTKKRKPQYKKTTKEKLLDFFSDRLG